MKKMSDSDEMSLIQSYNDIIIEYDSAIEQAKKEYQRATSHLSDVQRIDMLPLEEKQTIHDAARKVISLTRERKRYQSNENSLSEKQIGIFDRFEEEVNKDIQTISENEKFKIKINTDMKLLIEEKEKYKNGGHRLKELKEFYKSIGIIAYILIIMLFVVIISLRAYKGLDLQTPFFLTVITGVVVAVYILLGNRRIQKEKKTLGIKNNKVILLLNQVKIKAVNNSNLLNYLYKRYDISSLKELERLWKRYVKGKDDSNRYSDNTELLNLYQNELLANLERCKITNADIWIHFTLALIDEKEMVELRHALNRSRQNARKKIEDYNKEREDLIKQQKKLQE
ncbi:MAG TPA: hypothetical protein GXZ90_08500 [Clostridiales bacterium]|nr:hypothetical protein [Clostridiales bacterium]